jgi:hypothetical protein
MHGDRTTQAAYVIALILAIGYIAAGVVGWIADVTDGDSGDLAAWLALLLGGAALLLAGLFLVTRWSWPSTALVSLGTIAGALAVFWSIIAPLLAIALVVLAVLLARRKTAAA